MTEFLPPERDMFGVPLPPARGRGRPAFVATPEKTQLVNDLLAGGYADREIARHLSIDAKTLKKHFSRELAMRDEAAALARAKLRTLAWAQAEAGNVGAMKLLLAMYEREPAIAQTNRMIGKVQAAVAETNAKTAKAEKLGKKEAARETAHGVSGRFGARPAPIGAIGSMG